MGFLASTFRDWTQCMLSAGKCMGCQCPLGSALPRSPWCEVCSTTFTLWPAASCETCSAVLPGRHSRRCGGCSVTPSPIRSFHSVWIYGGAIQSAILRWKAPGSYGTGTRELARLVRDSGGAPRTDRETWVPIPGSPLLQKKRHFRPTLELAQELAHSMTATPPVHPLLREASRSSDGKRYYSVTRTLLPERVLLIDDVTTTGKTARSAAQALLDAGVQSVSFWCLARTPRPHEPCPHAPEASFLPDVPSSPISR